jgi:lysophospholipase L1-like esterase
MNTAVVRAWLVYFLTLLSVGLLNIDGVISWYGNRCEEREEVLRGLANVKRVHMETGLGPWLDQVECAMGFAFEGSYKDKSKCQGTSEGTVSVAEQGPAEHRLALDENWPYGAWQVVGSLESILFQVQDGSLVLHKTEVMRESERMTEDWRAMGPRNESKTQQENGNGLGIGLSSASQRLEADTPRTVKKPRPKRGTRVARASEASSDGRQPDKGQGFDGLASTEGAQSGLEFDPFGGPRVAKELAVTGKELAAVRDDKGVRPAGGRASNLSLDGEAIGNTEYQSVLLVGDSLAHGLAVSLGPDLKDRAGAAFSCFAKVSSGLSNPNVLNWEKTIQMLLQKGAPSLILIMMGVNDANNHIRDGNRLCLVGTPEWAQAYENRVESFLRIVSASHARVYWIGVPVVREGWLQSRVLLANMAARNACVKLENCHFIDTSDALCDENRNYTNYLKEANGSSVRIRAKDGVHFSQAGSNLLARYILLKLEDADNGSSNVRN